jgi:hypothetical protein
VGAKKVNVSITLVEELDARPLGAKKVLVKAADGLAPDNVSHFEVVPPEVSVTLFGAVNSLEAIDANKVQASVEVRGSDLISGNERRVKVDIAPQLSDIASKVEPDHVLIRPIK